MLRQMHQVRSPVKQGVEKWHPCQHEVNINCKGKCALDLVLLDRGTRGDYLSVQDQRADNLGGFPNVLQHSGNRMEHIPVMRSC
jgi:hypothetical protein